MAHRPAARLLLPVVGGLITLAGCSGTPFGDQLSRSFSGGGAAPSPSLVAAPQAGAGATNGGLTSPTPKTPAKTPANPPANPPPANPPAKPPVPAKPTAPAASPASAPASPPAPYRVTLKLPLADPSAPAEAVTRALRAAGVPFEVETIERVNGSTPVAPTITPAPAAR